MGRSDAALRAWALDLLLWGASLGICLQTISYHGGLTALFSDQGQDISRVIFRTMWLPEQCMAILAGAVLGACGWLMQRALNNPLAEPATLGMTAGAALSIQLTALWFPSALLTYRPVIIVAGEAGALLGVLLLSWRQRLSPLVTIQAGMMITLWCGALTMLAAVVNDRPLLTAMMWSGGTLAQSDSQQVIQLLVFIGGGLIGLLLILRPLALLQLPDHAVSSLGASPFYIRSFTLMLVLAMSAAVINAVGVIGFVGLAAPHLAQSGGARTSRQQILHSALTGSGLLWLTDLLASQLSGHFFYGSTLPVGMLTALAGGPLLILLAGGASNRLVDVPSDLSSSTSPCALNQIVACGVVLFIAVILALFFGNSPYGWHFSDLREMQLFLPLRLPRLLAAICAGCLLAGAGVLMQRITANPLASPEILGIGGGATVGVAVFVLLFPTGGNAMLIVSSSCGALISLTLTVWNSRRSAFSPRRVLLNGLAINALCQAVVGIIILQNPAVFPTLMSLTNGNTWSVTSGTASLLLFATLLSLSLAPLLRRWLLLLPMGTIAASLGIAVPRARIAVMALAALMTGFATLIIGPVSFVGLLGPHLARKAGAKTPLAQLFIAALFSALIMVVADWLGRNVIYPRQLPVGLTASLLGIPLLIWPLIRGGKPSR